MTSRRNFLAAAASTPLIVTPHLQAQTSTLSQAVLNGTLSTGLDAYAQVVANARLGPHLNRLRTASLIMFGHLKETGLSAQIQQGMTTRVMTSDDLNALASTTQTAAGVVISSAVMPSILAGATQAQTNLQTWGHDAMVSYVIEMFNDMATSPLAFNAPPRRNRLMPVRLLRVQMAPQLEAPPTPPDTNDACWYYGWVIFYLGWVAIFSPPPIDSILGIMVAIAGAAQAVFC